MAARRNNPIMKPHTVVYVLMVAATVAFTLFLLIFSERESDACKERGGTQVRTDGGYVCATLTPVPPPAKAQ